MAKDPDTGEIIDYFGGMEDLKSKILRTPLDTYVTLDDDPLRILRGIRFSITKNFGLCIVYKSLGDYIFTHLWLKPTNEK